MYEHLKQEDESRRMIYNWSKGEAGEARGSIVDYLKV